MKITSPIPGLNTKARIGAVELEFVDGVAETDNPAVIAYARRKGYGVGRGNPQDVERPEPPDPREVGTNGDGIEPVGTRLRDAAVDPKPEDFLPPTNAGQANPHGSQVVAPEIHASGPAGIVPGPVYVEEPDLQEDRETAAAQDLMVDDFDHGQVSEDAVPDVDDHGPLGLSDPGSVDEGVQAAAEQADDEPEQLKGQALDDALAAAGLPKSGTADEKRARLAEHRNTHQA